MKYTNKLSKIEKKFCKRVDGLAHKDCPDNCPQKITKEISKDRIRIFEKYESQINLKKEKRDNLYFLWVIEKGFKYDEKKAIKECAFIRKKFADEPDNLDPGGEGDIMKLRDSLRQMKKRKEKGRFVIQTKPKPISEIEAYRPSKDYFGSDITFENLKKKLESLIENGEDLNNENLRILTKNYRYPKDVIENFWDQLSEEYKEKKKNDNLFFDKGRRIKDREKPFDFNIYQLRAAEEKKIINRKEFMILRHRYNLEGYGAKSLRSTAGLLGISHSKVKEIEKKAIKKLQKHIHRLLKRGIEEKEGRELTRKEHKKKFDYSVKENNKKAPLV